MSKTNEEGERGVPADLILRITARVWRLPAQRRDAYVSRARARFDAGCGSRNDRALLRTIDFASLRGARG